MMCHLILFLPIFALIVFWLFPFPIAASIYIPILGMSFFFYIKIFQAMRMNPQLGQEAMLGQTGVVVREIDPEGKIEYFSEIWNAVSKGEKFSAGDRVCIAGFKGLTVLVQEVPAESRKPAKRFTCFPHRPKHSLCE